MISDKIKMIREKESNRGGGKASVTGVFKGQNTGNMSTTTRPAGGFRGTERIPY